MWFFKIIIQVSKEANRPVWYIFPGMGSQWPAMGRDLFQTVPPFQDAIIQCHKTLSKMKFKLIDLINNGEDTSYQEPLNAFVGICSIQV